MIYAEVSARLDDEKIEYSENTVLAQYTTFRIGGAARLVLFPKSADQCVLALDILRDAGIPILIIGNGSNLLVSDDGFDGAAVILTGMRSYSVSDKELLADAGVPLTKLALEASRHCLAGLEFSYGIPGTVGGAIYMNAGAYGGEISQVVTESEYYDLETGERGKLFGNEHDFAYRHSAYERGGRVILSARFSLSQGDSREITQKMNDFMSRRREKQPLEYPSAGSVFKRGDGFITSRVIDEAGLKGRTVGGAQVSDKHAGFIINKGGATAKDVLELISIIKSDVKAKYGFDIECEIKYIGRR